MRITTFASGSGGNCTLVSDGGTHILLDAGISLRRIRTGLARYGLTPEKLSGIFITHEHKDHVGGLPMLAKYTEVPIFAPRTVANHLRRLVEGVEKCLCEFHPNDCLEVGKLRINAFRTPHDTPESVGYRIEGGGGILGFCTDLGHVSSEVQEGLAGTTAVVLEANHDLEMLRYGPYPVFLKRRILSDNGHLSNESCAGLAVCLAAAGARYILLGHLSRMNNQPELALAVVRDALDTAGFIGVSLDIAPQAEHFSIEIEPYPSKDC